MENLSQIKKRFILFGKFPMSPPLSEKKGEIDGAKSKLNIASQLNNNSHCLIQKSSHNAILQDNIEEVIYSEGDEPEGYLYPNNTWDSDESPESDYI